MHEPRNALRRLRTRPGYSALAIALLGLGLGAALFTLTVVNGMFLEPLPFPQSERLMAMGHAREGSSGVGTLTSGDYLSIAREWKSFGRLAAFQEVTANLSPGGGSLPRRYNGVAFSHAMLELLGVQPILGRSFEADDDREGAALTVLLGERVWRRDFGADPAVLGRNLRANGEDATIIGVLPAGFAFPFAGEVWLPTRMQEGAGSWHVVAKLAPDVGPAQAQAGLEALVAHLGHALDGERDRRALRMVPLKERFVDATARRYVWMMFATGVLVLLLACINAGNLALGQATVRRRELALRSALGARRGTLVRELLAESLMIALVAAVFGLTLAHLGGQWLMQVLQANQDAPVYYVRFAVDLRMLGFGLAAVILTTLLAGLWPALRASRCDVTAVLRDGDKGSGGGFARLARGLVVGEIALTVVLLVGAGVLVRGLNAMLDFDLGTRIAPTQILTARVGLFPGSFPDAASQQRFFEQVGERLRAEPGVIAASTANALPGALHSGHEMIAAEGQPNPAGGFPQAVHARVDEHFLATYGVELLAGRGFDTRDDAGNEPVAIVDRRLAELLWPGQDALGRRLLVNPQRQNVDTLTVVGIIDGVHFERVDQTPLPTFLVPFRQLPTRFATLAVQTRGDALAMAPRLAEIVREVDADTPVYWVRSHAEAIRMGRIAPELVTQIFAAIGVLALLLAGSGLYGVLAFAVAQRTREIGIRRAIGAGRGVIIRNVSGRIGWQVALGLGIGIVLAVPWSVMLQSPNLHTRGYDPAVFGGVVAVVLAVALLACLAPLRRALRVDPVEALRHD
jgi:putative ABC transport system permease protein